MSTLSAKTPSGRCLYTPGGRWRARLTGRARGGRGRKSATPPVVVRFLWNSRAASSRQWRRSSAKSIIWSEQDRKEPRLSSAWNVPPSQDKLHIASRFIIPCPSWFGVSHYSRRPAGQLERELGGMTGAIIFSVLQAQPFFSSDTFIIKSRLLAPSMNTKILLKGQESTHWNLFIFVVLHFLLRQAWWIA